MRRRSNLKKWSLIIFLSLFVIYGLYESGKLILGPKIYIESPIDGQSFEKSLIDVKGAGKNVAFITLNGKPIFLDKEGRINEKLILSPGYNIMTLRAEDRFKRSVEKRMQFNLLGEMPKQIFVSTSTESERSASTTASTSPKASTSTETSTTIDINN